MVQRKTNLDATECAVLTGTGRSAIAVIGLRGPGSTSTIQRCFAPATSMTLSIGQIRYGNWTGADAENHAGESVVVTPIGDDQFEIHCHGGSAAIARIISDLRAFSAIQIETADWTEVDNLLVREARQVLARCLTARTAAIAMDQVRGALVDWVNGWIDTLSEPTALAAGPDNPRRGPAASAVGSLVDEARQIVAHAPLTTRLNDPFRVVLVGPPNVGKSSLVNAMVGYDRSITYDEAGTTRDVLHADTVIDGIPIRLSDTAGIRESDGEIEKEGIARAQSAAEQADLVLIVSSPEPKALAAGPSWMSATPEASARGSRNTIHIFNKADLLSADETPPENSIPTNAVTGDGIPDLLKRIAGHLGQSMPDFGQPAPLTTRQADLLWKVVDAKSPSNTLQILIELLGSNS